MSCGGSTGPLLRGVLGDRVDVFQVRRNIQIPLKFNPVQVEADFRPI